MARTWSAWLLRGRLLDMALTNAADGTSIHYTDLGGSGPGVIMVHGITESARTWDPVVALLRDDYRVITMDLRGHGQSALADRYDLEAMATDVVAVSQAAGCERPHIVGHSLGGAVVSAVGAAMDVASVVNVDQSLQLGSFKEGLTPAEPMLRDPAAFTTVIDGLFEQMKGPLLSASEMDRVNSARQPKQDVVLGVWELIFSMSTDEINGVVEEALGGYANRPSPYLSLFGIDPGDGYAEWLQGFVDGAIVELWEDHGHYPHLVDPERFVQRLSDFWRTAA